MAKYPDAKTLGGTCDQGLRPEHRSHDFLVAKLLIKQQSIAGCLPRKFEPVNQQYLTNKPVKPGNAEQSNNEVNSSVQSGDDISYRPVVFNLSLLHSCNCRMAGAFK